MRHLFILLLLGLAACGQKGDLYLPDRTAAIGPLSCHTSCHI
ncbi:MAG: LPS translocon maturation chaperone LptM [Gammaproteobacteria bacterium]